MNQPKRIQLSRRKGWRKPDGAVVCSRPGTWGNPFVVDTETSSRVVVVWDTRHDPQRWVSEYATKTDAQLKAVGFFCAALFTGNLTYDVDDVRRELRGKDLCCWCRLGDACHADILLRAANSDGPLTLDQLTATGGPTTSPIARGQLSTHQGDE